VSSMCNLSEGVMRKGMARGIAKGVAKGVAKGRTEGIVSSIQSLMETMNLSPDQAMAALKVPEAERQKYVELLKKQ